MNIKILIVEDDPLTSQDLKEIIQENGMQVVGIAKNKAEAKDIISGQYPDILVVDINLKDGDSGIDLVMEVNSDQKLPVVFLTANSDKETVDKALRTNPASYLTKPYDDKDVIIALELAFNNHFNKAMVSPAGNGLPFIFLKSGTRFEKISLEQIHYLKADGSYTRFVTADKEYTLSGNLNTISEKINNPSFIRIHRSYIVNVNSITGVDNNYVFIDTETLPISRSYKEAVNRVIQKIS